MTTARIFFLLLLFCLHACAPPANSHLATQTGAPVSPELAAQYAVDTLQTDTAVGHLVGRPSLLRGEIMPIEKAYALVNGKPLDDGLPLARRRADSVWLVVTRGSWLLHIPGGHGDPLRRTPTVMSKDVIVRDHWNAIYFDAATGLVHEQGGVVESQRATLQKLAPLFYPRRGQ